MRKAGYTISDENGSIYFTAGASPSSSEPDLLRVKRILDDIIKLKPKATRFSEEDGAIIIYSDEMMIAFNDPDFHEVKVISGDQPLRDEEQILGNLRSKAKIILTEIKDGEMNDAHDIDSSGDRIPGDDKTKESLEGI